MNDKDGIKLKTTVNLHAKSLGVSREGLRFYEQKGILNPERDSNSGYRIYSEDDIITFIVCRKYVKYGFSLDKVCDMVRAPSSPGILQDFYDQQDALLNEIEEKKRVLSSLQGKIQQLEDISSHQGEFSVVRRPPIYWIEVQRNKIYQDTPQQIARTKRWNGFSPYIDTIVVWSLKKLLGQEGMISAGLMIEERDVGAFPVNDGYYLPETKCLYTAKEIQGYPDLTETLFNEMLEYMRGHGLTPTGDGVARSVRIYIDEERMCHFLAQLWIPID